MKYKDCKYQITGCTADSAPSNYELEEMVEEEFGENVLCDSEHSQFFCYTDNYEIASEILEFVKKHGNDGEYYTTYGAGKFKSVFTIGEL